MLTLCLSLSDSCARLNGDLLQDCRKRFFHSLAPDLKKGRWSKEEDALLLKGLEEMGPIWYKVRLSHRDLVDAFARRRSRRRPSAENADVGIPPLFRLHRSLR